MPVRPSAYLGIDLGTSGLKVALVDSDGLVVAESEASYQVAAPRPGWAETDPEDWWSAVESALAAIADALRRHEVRGVGVDGQMHGVALCDAGGRALRPAVLWPDTRARDHVTRWAALPESMRARLANPLAAGMFGPIVAWLADEEPDVVARAEVALLPKDVVRARLGGGVVTDRSDASATLLWDVSSDAWDVEVAREVGIPLRLLPDVLPSDAAVGRAVVDAGSPALAAVAGAPLVTGCGDTPAALLAAGAGDGMVVNLGTGIQVMHAAPGVLVAVDPPVHSFADALGGWYRMAAAQNGGLAVEWACRVLGADWEEAVRSLDDEPSSAVSFLPFLTGERGALARPGSRASWLGLGLSTTRADLLRSAMEAMAFAVRRCHDLLAASRTNIGTGARTGTGTRTRPGGRPVASGVVSLTGGGTRASQVQQLLADVLQAPVQRLAMRSASAMGAAALAARADAVVLAPHVIRGPVIEPRPDPALTERYGTWLALTGGTA